MKDRNGDGRIDVEEFRSLMKSIGDEVRGDTVAVMFDSMDIHGSLDFDEFFAILEVILHSLVHSVRMTVSLYRPSPFVPVRRQPECSDLFRDMDTMGIDRSGWITSERLYLLSVYSRPTSLFCKTYEKIDKKEIQFPPICTAHPVGVI